MSHRPSGSADMRLVTKEQVVVTEVSFPSFALTELPRAILMYS